jgi:ribosomal protein S18 acetylase RimI-like enzyme
VAASSRKTGLRPASPADAGALARLEQRAFIGYYAAHRFSEEQFRYYLARPTTIAHVVELAGTIVAYSLGVQNTASRRHLVRLHSIAVGAAARDRRLGGRLLDAFLTEARRRRCRRAYLEVGADNRPALALFARHGFVATARLRSFYARSVDGVRMRCELTRAGLGPKRGRR